MIMFQVGKELKAARGETPKLGRKLTQVEQFALAFASLTIHRLPEGLQEWINAYDMQSMLVGKSCGRDSYILGQALHMLEGFTSRTRENLDAVGKYKDIRKDVERLVAVAIEEHRQEEAAVDELVKEAKAARGVPIKRA
jgi:hypothetical protein